MNHVPDAQQFSALEPSLWRVLGVLARRGYPVPPDEARDLIHDFYLDAWSGLRERFDARLSAFTTYAAAAFYRFARRRVMDLCETRSRLVDLELALEHASEAPTPAELAETGQGLALMHAALRRLPAPQRSLLVDFAATSSGERDLAERHRITRHALRTLVAEAISRLALELGAMPDTGALESRVAAALWREGLSARGVADLLGLSVAQVQALRQQTASRLLAALRGSERQRSPPLVTSRSQTMHDALRTLRTALLEPGNQAALREVKKNAEAVRAALADDAATDQLIDTAAFDRLSEHPKWLAQVYEAIGADASGHTESAGAWVAEMRRAHEDEQVEVGHAFQRLLVGLSLKYHEWEHWFRNAPTLSGREADLIRTAAAGAVASGGPHAETLLRWGVTPLAVQQVTVSWEYLFDRTRRAVLRPNEGRRIPDWSDASIPGTGVFVEAGLGAVNFKVPSRVLEAQMAGVGNLPACSVAPLRSWVLSVLVERPYLVPGHVYDAPEHLFARLEPSSPDLAAMPDDLELRWCRPAPTRYR